MRIAIVIKADEYGTSIIQSTPDGIYVVVDGITEELAEGLIRLNDAPEAMFTLGSDNPLQFVGCVHDVVTHPSPEMRSATFAVTGTLSQHVSRRS